MKNFEAKTPNICTAATAPLRTRDPNAILVALDALSPPFDDDVRAELIALGFAHDSPGVRKKAMALANEHIPDTAKIKAAYKTVASQPSYKVEERMRALDHPLTGKIATAMLFHRHVGVSIAFERDAKARAALLDIMVEGAKRDRKPDVMLAQVEWCWRGHSGLASQLDLHELPPSLFVELTKRRKRHPFTGLNFHGGSLTRLPDELAKTKSWLKSLNLGFNPLTELPEVVLACTNLESLSLHGTEMTDIPAGISKLKKLRHLDLGNGKKMKTIPESVCALDKLETLRIGNGSIRIIPEAIGQMKSLRELHMQSTRIAKAPASLGTLPNLKSIRMAFSRRLDRKTVKAVVGRGVTVHT